MSITNIAVAILVLGLLGAFFGVILAFASRVFAVERDDRLDLLVETLPGVNCGGCGYAGCTAYAEALVAGTAKPGSCPTGGDLVTEKIAEILGVEAKKNVRIAALVRCAGGDHAKRKYDYAGTMSCIAANELAGSPLECNYGCLGLGTCVKSCFFDAIHIVNGVAVVDPDKCTGCMQCIRSCPRHIIVAVPYSADVNVVCSNHDRGPALKNVCEIGCLGCRLCEKTCQYDAIHVTDNLASIDYDKCVRCGECAKKCPRHLIVDSQLLKPHDVTDGSKIGE